MGANAANCNHNCNHVSGVLTDRVSPGVSEGGFRDGAPVPPEEQGKALWRCCTLLSPDVYSRDRC